VVYDGRHGGRGRVHEAVEADRMANTCLVIPLRRDIPGSSPPSLYAHPGSAQEVGRDSVTPAQSAARWQDRVVTVGANSALSGAPSA